MPTTTATADYRLPDIDRPYGYINCADAVNFAKAHGLFNASGHYSAGDIIFYCWDGSGVAEHTGIVVSDDGVNVHTIEGNTSPTDAGSQTNGGGVYAKVRPHGSTIVGVMSLAKLVKFMGWASDPADIAKAVLAVARTQIGYVEKGGAGNDSGNITKYWAQTDKSLQGESWCADFVSWVYEHAKLVAKAVTGLSAPTRAALATVTAAGNTRKSSLSAQAKARVTGAIKALKAMRAK